MRVLFHVAVILISVFIVSNKSGGIELKYIFFGCIRFDSTHIYGSSGFKLPFLYLSSTVKLWFGEIMRKHDILFEFSSKMGFY